MSDTTKRIYQYTVVIDNFGYVNSATEMINGTLFEVFPYRKVNEFWISAPHEFRASQIKRGLKNGTISFR